MTDTSPHSALRNLASPRDDLLAFEVIGKIHRPDIEWMARRVEQAFVTFDRIDMLILMTDFEGAKAGAVFDPKALEIEARSLGHVRRYAVVGAPTWVEIMIKTSDLFIPVDARSFDLDRMGDAWAWLDED